MPTTTAIHPAIPMSSEPLDLDTILRVARGGVAVELSRDPEFRRRLELSRETLMRKLQEGEVIYGVNTGFGGNARFVIPREELAHHQQNLLEFLCCGVGEPLPEAAVRAVHALIENGRA